MRRLAALFVSEKKFCPSQKYYFCVTKCNNKKQTQETALFLPEHHICSEKSRLEYKQKTQIEDISQCSSLLFMLTFMKKKATNPTEN